MYGVVFNAVAQAAPAVKILGYGVTVAIVGPRAICLLAGGTCKLGSKVAEYFKDAAKAEAWNVVGDKCIAWGKEHIVCDWKLAAKFAAVAVVAHVFERSFSQEMDPNGICLDPNIGKECGIYDKDICGLYDKDIDMEEEAYNVNNAVECREKCGLDDKDICGLDDKYIGEEVFNVNNFGDKCGIHENDIKVDQVLDGNGGGPVIDDNGVSMRGKPTPIKLNPSDEKSSPTPNDLERLYQDALRNPPAGKQRL